MIQSQKQLAEVDENSSTTARSKYRNYFYSNPNRNCDGSNNIPKDEDHKQIQISFPEKIIIDFNFNYKDVTDNSLNNDTIETFLPKLIKLLKIN